MLFFKQVSRKKLTALKRWYSEQLKEKDKEIEDLKFRNRTLLNAAIRQSQKLEDIKLKLEIAVKKQKKSKS